MQASNKKTDLRLQITGEAVARLKVLVADEPDDGVMLRIRVDAGGCSGFQYAFDFDGKIENDDLVFTHDGIGVVIDEPSLTLLDNSIVDYVEELMGAAFVIKNPNANASCGCGNSFSVG